MYCAYSNTKGEFGCCLLLCALAGWGLSSLGEHLAPQQQSVPTISFCCKLLSMTPGTYLSRDGLPCPFFSNFMFSEVPKWLPSLSMKWPRVECQNWKRVRFTKLADPFWVGSWNGESATIQAVVLCPSTRCVMTQDSRSHKGNKNFKDLEKRTKRKRYNLYMGGEPGTHLAADFVSYMWGLLIWLTLVEWWPATDVLGTLVHQWEWWGIPSMA